MFRSCARTCFCSLATALAFFCSAAQADETHGDGLYQRLDHDFVISFAAGVHTSTQSLRAAPDAELRVRYWDTLGILFDVHALDAGATHPVMLITALDIRPLFAFRFFRNQFVEVEWVDRWLDSFGLDIGIRWPIADARLGDAPAFVLGAGCDLPLWPLDLLFVRLSGRAIFATQVEGQVLALLGIRFSVGHGSGGWPFN